jgi:hypothetical protein
MFAAMRPRFVARKQFKPQLESRARPDEARQLEAVLFDLFFQNHRGSRIHVVNLAACRTGHWLIDVVVLRDFFGDKALNAVSGFRAAVHE